MPRRLRFGLWYDFRNPSGRSFEDFYAETLDQIVWAEELGYGSVWLTEHHFVDDGYTPSPLVIGGALLARTTRLHMSTSLMLLPLHDPIRLAEDAATLSILSRGRFDLGLGLGYRKGEFTGFGIPARERASRMNEALPILRRLFAGERVTTAARSSTATKTWSCARCRCRSA